MNGTMAFLRDLARHFISDDIAADESSLPYQQAFFLFLTLVITVTASLLCCITFVFLGKAILVTVNVSACLLGVTALVIWYRKKKVFVPLNIVIFGLIALNVVAMVLTGGLYSLLVFNFIIPQVLTLVFYGPQRMMQLFVLWAIIVGAFIVLEVLGKTPPPIFLLTSNGLIYGGITLILLIGMLGAFYIADAIRQESYAALQLERDTVQTRIDEATRNLEEQQENIALINYQLEERNIALQEAIHAAEDAKQLQADFLRNASHEVRTPLAVIMGFGEILTEQISEDNIGAQESLKHISDAAENLLGIFNSVLMLSTLESTDILISPVRLHLRGFVEQIQKEFVGKTKVKGLDLLCEYISDDEEYCMIDVVYLRQVIHHLLSNAIKFTAQGTVRFSCEVCSSSATNQGEVIRFIVADTGVGIAPEFQAKLFVPFHQQDAGKTRLYGGLGLGLAISKRIVEIMHGRVWCESELGNGATFIVDIPKA